MSAKARADHQLHLPPVEVNRVHRGDEGSLSEVNKVHPDALSTAKARVGGAVREAIGTDPMKVYGHKGLLHAVCSGEKVPDYLARIYQDKPARRRFALALLNDDTDVVVTTHVSWPEPKVRRA